MSLTPAHHTVCDILLRQCVALHCAQSHSTKVATLEASLQQQSDALADLAATLADLPGKGGLLEVRDAAAAAAAAAVAA